MTTGEEEDNMQIQPHTREKIGKRDRIFWFDGKDYASYSLMVEAKRERNRGVLEQSGLLDMLKWLNVLVAKHKSPELHYYAKEASSDSENEKGKIVNVTPTKVARAHHKNTNHGKI